MHESRLCASEFVILEADDAYVESYWTPWHYIYKLRKFSKYSERVMIFETFSNQCLKK